MVEYFRRWRRVLLLFSGGLDSGLLLAWGREVLGQGLTALTVTGPHIVPGETHAAWDLARRLGVRHLLMQFDPLSLPDFASNRVTRCYACKKAMLAQAGRVAARIQAEVMWDGTNLDDLKDYRPGLKAAFEAGVVSPLVELGLGKKEIRQLSRKLGLPAHKAPQSCLATRFPYDTLLTREDLARVGRGEAWLRHRGFGHVRLRVRGEEVYLELPAEDWPRFFNQGFHRPFAQVLRGLGFGNLNLAL
jgi:uncharacterized protein